MLLLLAPGQGSQTPGMLNGWLELPGARATVDRWSELTGLDMATLGTSAPAEALRATDLAQPLLTSVALLSGRAALADQPADMVCGHSVGELSALALAGVLSDDDAVVLAARRGTLMAEAAAACPSGMAAVMGPVMPDVEELEAAGLELATVNDARQAVVGGPVEALDAWSPPEGLRVRRLDVAGAFHTSAMAPAVDAFASLVGEVEARDACCDVIANADGAVLRDGRTLLNRLVRQLVQPVRFDLCLAAAAGASRVVELAPARVLAPMARRALHGVPVTALQTPADLPSAA